MLARSPSVPCRPQPLWCRIVGHVLIVALVALQLQPAAYAAPVADPTGNLGFAPNIQLSPQGVPIINITAPNAHGVSLNTYGRFDVDALGVILNNSLTGGGSLLGGQISANPNFNGRTASVVVNEVMGASRSQLQGQVELFGAPAWVVIVNPNGIQCNGCGGTNIPQLTLSTGAVQWRDTTGQPVLPGDASAFTFDVREGDIAVGPLGVEGTRSRIDLIAPHITLGGAVRGGDQLNVIAGQQTVDAATLHTSHVTSSSAPVSPFLIDAGALGAMSAGSISLMVNGAGAGVRSLAPITAQTQNLLIQADGSLQLTSSFAQEQIDITSRHGSVTLDSTTGLAAVSIDAEGTISTRGPLEAGGDLSLTSRTGTVQLSGNTLAVDDLTINAPYIALLGDTASGQQTRLTGDQITISQPLTAIGGATLRGDQVNVQAEIATRDGLDIVAQQLILGRSDNGARITGDLSAFSQDIRADGGLTVTGSASLSSSHDLLISSVITGGSLRLFAQNDLSVGNINAGGSVSLSAGNRLALNSGIYGDSVYLSAPLLDIVHAITAVQNIGLTGNTLNVAADLTAGGTVSANVQNDAVFDGDIYAGNGLSIQTGGSLQFHRDVVAGGYSTLTAGNDLIAQAGFHTMDLTAVAGHDLRFAQDLLSGGVVTLWATNDLAVQGNTIASQSLTAGAGNQIFFAGTVDAGALNLTGPQIRFDGDVSVLRDAAVVADVVTLPHRFVAGGSAHLSVASGGIESLGQLMANEDLILESAQSIALAESGAGRNAQLTAHHGAITLGHDFSVGNNATLTAGDHISTAALNVGGNLTATAAGEIGIDRIAANGALSLSSIDTLTVHQNVDVGNDALLVSGNDILIGGALSSGGRLDITAANALRIGGDTGANEGITLTAQSGDIVVGGNLVTNGALEAEAGQSLHVAGNVETLQALTLVAGDGITVGGDITAGDGAQIAATAGSVALGNLGSGASITVTAGQHLSTGDLLVDGDTTLTAAAGDLHTGGLSSNGEARLVAGNDMTVGGVLEVVETATLTAGGNITTLADVLIGGDYLVNLGGNLIHGGGTLILGNAGITSGGSQAYRGDLLVSHDLNAAAGNGFIVAGSVIGVDRVNIEAGSGDAFIVGDTYSGATLDIAADGDIAIGGFVQGRGVTLESRNAGVYVIGATLSEGALTAQAQDDIFFGGLVGASGNISGVSDGGSITFNNGLMTLADVSLHAHRDLVFDGETSLGGVVDLKADTGTLSNLGSMLLAQPATIDITGNFANTGSLIVNGDFGLSAQNITIDGTLIALGGITAAAHTIATGNDSIVNAVGDIALTGQQTTNRGTLAAGEALTVTGSFGNSGLTVAGDTVTISGGNFTNSGTLYAPEVAVTGSGGNNSGLLSADGTLSVVVSGGFGNSGQIAADTVSLTGSGVGNSSAISGNSISIGGGLSNSGVVSGGAVSLTGGSVHNTLSESQRCRPDLEEPCAADNPAHHIYAQNPAIIAATDTLNITGTSLTNQGIIQAGALTANVSGAITNTRSVHDPYNESNWNKDDEDDSKSPATGIIVAGSSLSLNGGSIANQGGVIQSGGSLSMTANGAIVSANNGSDDVAPLIIAQGDLTIRGASVSLDGITLSTGANAFLTATGGNLINNGITGASQNLTLAASGNAINTNALLADGTISVTGQGISNSGVIYQFSSAPEAPKPEEGEAPIPAPPSGPNAILLNAGTGMLWNSGNMMARNNVDIRAGAYGAVAGASQIASYGDISLTIPGFVGTGALMSTLNATNTLNLNIAGVTVGVGDLWTSGAQTVNLGNLTNYGNVFLAGRLNGNASNLVTLGTDSADSLPNTYVGGGCPQSGPDITCELVDYQAIHTRGQLIVQGGISGTLYNEAAAYTAPSVYSEHVPLLAVTWRITDETTGGETYETVIARDNLPANLPILLVPGSATVEIQSPISGYIIGEDLTLTGGDIIIAPLDNGPGQAAINDAQNAAGGNPQNPNLGSSQTVSGAVIIGPGTYPGQTVTPIGASGFASLDEAMIAAGLDGNLPEGQTVQAGTGSRFYQNVYAPDFFRIPEPRQPEEGEVAEPWEFPTGWANPGELPSGTVAAQQLNIDVNTLTNYGTILTFIPRDENDKPIGDYTGNMGIITHDGLFNYGTIYAAGDLDITGSVYNSRPFEYDEFGNIVLETVTTNWGRNTPDYLRDQCRADQGHCITVEERVPGPAAVIGAGGDMFIHGDVTNIASTISAGGNLTIDGLLTNQSIVLETLWNSRWREWRGHLSGYTTHNESGADYSRVAQGVVAAGRDLETGLNINTGVIIAGTPPDPEKPGDEGIKGNITIHGGHTGMTDPNRPTPVNVAPANPGETTVPVMPGTIYATGDITIDGGNEGTFGNTGAVIAGGNIIFDTSNGPLTVTTGTRTVRLDEEHRQTIFVDSDNWYIVTGDVKQPGGVWIAGGYEYDSDSLTIDCKDCSFRITDEEGNAFMTQIALDLGDAWSFERIDDTLRWELVDGEFVVHGTRVRVEHGGSWRTSDWFMVGMFAIAVIISALCYGSCAPAAFSTLFTTTTSYAIASAAWVAAITSVVNALMMGRFDLRQFLQSIAIAAVTAGVISALDLGGMGYDTETVRVNPPEGHTWENGVTGVTSTGAVAGTVTRPTDWSRVFLGALGQGAINAVVAELTGGDVGQAFIMAFAMAFVRALAIEMRYNEAVGSAQMVSCNQVTLECRPNFTVGPNGEIQLGGVRMDPGKMCNGQTKECTMELITGADGTKYWAYTPGNPAGLDG
ncbi:MAG: filamentous hemagglutinin N-terminal domain-containing protein, partial [Burkholderiales bacterium]|nr:filamentous hemagglutinin N-terminal domain-containing protein [Burkholderiales bacterium]